MVDPPCAGKLRHPAERDVLADREVSDRCLGMAVWQYQREPQPPREQGRHGIGGYPLAADVQADRGGNRATHGSGEYLAPGTGQPGDAQHLAAADVEVDARDRRAAQAADLEHGRFALGLRRGVCGGELELLADDQAREPPAVDAGRRDRSLAPAIPQHRHLRGQAQHFVETVRDVQDADPVLPDLVQDAEQRLALRRRQGAGRLVEHEQRDLSRAVVEGARDRERAALDRAKLPHRPVDVEFDADARQQPLRLTPLGASVDTGRVRAEAGDKADVLRRGQLADEAQVLVDESQAPPAGVGRRPEVQRLAVHEYPPARVRQVKPGQDLDQRRLAGAVLADERVDRTAVDVERHIRERPLPGKGLRQVLDRHQRRSWLGHRSVSTGTVSTSTVSTDAAPAAYADLALARSGYHPLPLAAPAVLARAVPA